MSVAMNGIADDGSMDADIDYLLQSVAVLVNDTSYANDRLMVSFVETNQNGTLANTITTPTIYREVDVQTRQSQAHHGLFF